MGMAAFAGPMALGMGNAFGGFGALGGGAMTGGQSLLALNAFKDLLSPNVPKMPPQPPPPPPGLQDPKDVFTIQPPFGLLETQKKAAALGTSQLLVPLDFINAP
jgi:hypothetical protein